MLQNDEKIIILEDAKFFWSVARINQALELFEKGFLPSEVAQIMNEKIIDTGLVYLHLIDKGKLKR